MDDEKTLVGMDPIEEPEGLLIPATPVEVRFILAVGASGNTILAYWASTPGWWEHEAEQVGWHPADLIDLKQPSIPGLYLWVGWVIPRGPDCEGGYDAPDWQGKWLGLPVQSLWTAFGLTQGP